MARVYKEDLCDECNKYKKEVYFRQQFGLKLCKYCNKIYKEHPFLFYPQKGVRAFDENGRLICHICGRAFEGLSHHIHTKHNMSLDEYKHIYGLTKNKSLISENLKDTYKESVYEKNLKGNESKGLPFAVGDKRERHSKMSLEAKLKMKGVNRFKEYQENKNID